MKAHFPQLTAALDNRTSPPVIVDLADDAGPALHAGNTAWNNDKPPPVNMTILSADQA